MLIEMSRAPIKLCTYVFEIHRLRTEIYNFNCEFSIWRDPQINAVSRISCTDFISRDN